MKNPIFVALDVDDPARALALAKDLRDVVGGAKLGPRLINRAGARLVQDIAEYLPVFVDQKFYDIPSTMAAAVRTAFESGASYATIHALSGPKAMAQMAALEAELSKTRPFQILAVTILTSFDAQTLPAPLRGREIPELVKILAAEVFASGLSGIVCSPHEAALVRALDANAFIVTPGVRPATAAADDQSRVMTPTQALQQGASALVIGRPIIAAPNPLAAARTCLP
jgi:orotidine-5'-phosphate decarboxylase